MRAAVLAAAAALLGGCYAPPPTYGDLPEFSLTAVSSKTPPRAFSRGDLLGRVWVADFVFTHCGGPCPALSLRMAKLQRDLPSPVGLLTFTVDPDRDDAAVLAAYAARFGAQPERWLFVGGPKPKLMPLLIEGFKLPVVENAAAPSDRRVTHSARFVLIDREARLRGYFDGDDDAAMVALKRAASNL